MNVTIYTTTALIEHTNADRVEEHGSFLCIYEGDIIFKYHIKYIIHLIETHENSDKDLQF